MVGRKHILTVVGARPQFVKAAALSREILKSNKIRETIIHTGQHFDVNMSDVFFDELEIPEPKWNLGIHGGTHGEMTGKMLPAIENAIVLENPDLLLIYGDTNSTLAAAIAASKLNVPIAHVEAGLRSFNREMPEEQNRIVADHLSSIFFCPSIASVRNLTNEGIVSNVFHVGDVMYDAVKYAIGKFSGENKFLSKTKLCMGRYALVTIHRAENTKSVDHLSKIVTYIKKVGTEYGGIIWPMHPRTRDFLQSSSIETDGINIVDPMGYFEFQRLIQDSAIVVTDSGGLQKEAYFHGKPCITLRDQTEWVETIANGWNRLWTQPDYNERVHISDYGDGNASAAIVAEIENFLG